MMTPERIEGEKNSYPVTIAILYFENNSISQRERLDFLRKGLADMLINDLSQVRGINVVERGILQALLEELNISTQEITDQETNLKIGKILGAKIILLGSYSAYMEQIRIDIRMVEVETGLTLYADEVTGKVEEIFILEKEIVLKITERLNIEPDLKEKERLSHAARQSLKVIEYYGRGLDYQDSKQYDKALEMYIEALKINPDYQEAKDRIEEITLRQQQKE